MSVERGHPPKVVRVGTGNSSTTTVAELIRDRASEISQFEAQEDIGLMELR